MIFSGFPVKDFSVMVYAWQNSSKTFSILVLSAIRRIQNVSFKTSSVDKQPKLKTHICIHRMCWGSFRGFITLSIKVVSPLGHIDFAW